LKGLQKDQLEASNVHKHGLTTLVTFVMITRLGTYIGTEEQCRGMTALTTCSGRYLLII